MLTRRNFIRAGGISLLAPAQVLALQDQKARRSWTDIVFSNHVVAPAPSRPQPDSWRADTISAAWIGHATGLKNFFGTKIITHPVLSESNGIKVLGLFTPGPQRPGAPPLQRDEAPAADFKHFA